MKPSHLLLLQLLPCKQIWLQPLSPVALCMLLLLAAPRASAAVLQAQRCALPADSCVATAGESTPPKPPNTFNLAALKTTEEEHKCRIHTCRAHACAYATCHDHTTVMYIYVSPHQAGQLFAIVDQLFELLTSTSMDTAALHATAVLCSASNSASLNRKPLTAAIAVTSNLTSSIEYYNTFLPMHLSRLQVLQIQSH
jgi:hypothetical protein